MRYFRNYSLLRLPLSADLIDELTVLMDELGDAFEVFSVLAMLAAEALEEDVRCLSVKLQTVLKVAHIAFQY